MSEAWTVQRVLAWMTQDFTALAIPTPRLDAELLLCRALECDRVRLYMDMQRPLEARELEAARALVVRRRKREPVAYILGRREFYRHGFEVTRDVLIPRPETEVLVDRALEVAAAGAELRALDLCTGSGAIAITLALERAQLQVDATDISQAALDVAARNAAQPRRRRSACISTMATCSTRCPRRARYALVVANPPYVADAEWSALAPEIREHEPRAALLAGARRSRCARAAVRERWPAWLEPGGTLLFEVGHTQAPRRHGLAARQQRFEAIAAHKDLAGIARIVAARLRGGELSAVASASAPSISTSPANTQQHVRRQRALDRCHTRAALGLLTPALDARKRCQIALCARAFDDERAARCIEQARRDHLRRARDRARAVGMRELDVGLALHIVVALADAVGRDDLHARGIGRYGELHGRARATGPLIASPARATSRIKRVSSGK